jgi:hypothetical protein
MARSIPKPQPQTVRTRDLRHDPRAALRGALAKPIRVSAKEGGRLYHVATIRRGNRKDPSWRTALPVTIAALEDRAGRILALAGALQIALRVQLTPTGLDVFFIEPAAGSLAFTAARLGGLGATASALKTAMRRSPIARAEAVSAGKRADARRRREITALESKIATLERAAKRGGSLAAELKTAEAALQEARRQVKTAENAAKKAVQDRDSEIQTLKTQIASLNRALKKRTAVRELNGSAAIPDPETAPPASAEA